MTDERLSAELGARIFLKAENTQRSGPRGSVVQGWETENSLLNMSTLYSM